MQVALTTTQLSKLLLFADDGALILTLKNLWVKIDLTEKFILAIFVICN